MAFGFGFGMPRSFAAPAFTPRSLFSTGAQGAWYDPSDRSTLFQDAAGTTPVTAVEQPVGLMLDKSKGLVLGSNISQVASATYTTYQDTTIAVGLSITKNYLITFSYSLSSGSLSLQGDFLQSPYSSVSGNGTYSAVVRGGTFINVHAGPATGAATNISVRELPGNHAFQTTAASRPVLSARVNLLTKTEQFDDAVWTAVNGTVTKTTGQTAPDGSSTATQLVFSGANMELRQSVTSGTAGFTQGFWLKGTAGQTLAFGLSATSGSTDQSVTLTGSWQFVSYSPTSVVGLVRFWLGTWNSATARTVVIWHPDLRVSNDGVGIPAYQRVNTSTDYDTAGFPLYLKTDGVDDWMQTNSINFTATDKMTVCVGVRKLVDQSNAILVELSTSAGTSNPGSFNLHAPIATGPSYASYLFGTASISSTNTLVTTYTAPITNVVTVQHDIAASGAAAEIRFRVNAVSNTGTSFGDAGTGNFGNYPLYLFRRGGFTLPFNGRFYGMTVVGKTLTAGELVNLETYTNQKTGAY